jgi:acetolactate synthase I/II/III large subunit
MRVIPAALRPWRRSIRARIVIACAALFLVLGAILIGVAYTQVGRVLEVPSGQPGGAIQPGGPARISTTTDASKRAGFLVFTLAGLGVGTLLAAGLGWAVSRRVLRPLTAVTTAAQLASQENLDRRLALAGPPDELKELADTFDAMLARLEAAFASQRRFVANASHELRTPLTEMRTLIDVTTARPGVSAAELAAALTAIGTAVDRSEELIEALLTLARSDRGLGPAELVDLPTAVEDAIDLIAPAAAARQIRIEVALHNAQVTGDRVLLERLVSNLIDNAVKHNVTGGWVLASTRTSAGAAELIVANGGEHIPADQVAGLFEPFRRLQGRTGNRPGTGLGLSIVASVARAHGGHAQARAGPEGGLDVQITLPATVYTATATATAATAATANAATANGRRPGGPGPGLPAGNVAGVVQISGHGGVAALAAARRYGVQTLFTLSGGHIFPLYDAAVKGGQPVRLVDVRHEQTAVFAAEATARLTRLPGLAAVTAGPGVTNTVSAVTTAWLNGAPVVVLAGRAPDSRWGQGSLQEIDHPPLLAPVTKRAWTEHDPAGVAGSVDEAFRIALSPHRGPVFLDLSLEAIYGTADTELADVDIPTAPPPDPADVSRIAGLLRAARRPVLILGSDVWLGGAEGAARRAAEELRLPVVANGQARGVLPRGHDLLVTRARSTALREADLVLVAGTPLDFRLAYGSFGQKNNPAQVVHVADGPDGVAAHVPLAASAHGDLGAFFDGLAGGGPVGDPDWVVRLAGAVQAALEADGPLLTSDADPVHPARVYGELLRVLDDDAVVIGDGGDFVSFAGKYVEPARPGGWLDPGPFGCLGTGLGYAIAARLARPSGQVVLLLGDGAAGFSLMDADTLVRHKLPVVIVCGNNGAWGLEKHPMRALYGYDVLADLQPACRYDEVVRALGGAGELVTSASGIGPALRRAFASGVPYLVNVVTDPEIAYPRSTTGV